MGMTQRNRNKKWILCLLAAGVWGGCSTIPVMAERLDGTFFGSESSGSYEYINYDREVNYDPTITLLFSDTTLTGPTDREDNELFTYLENPNRDMAITLKWSQLHIGTDDNAIYKITGKVKLWDDYEERYGVPYPHSSISVDHGTLKLNSLDISIFDSEIEGLYTLTGNFIIDKLSANDYVGLNVGSDTQAAHVSIANQIAPYFDRGTNGQAVEGYIFLHSSGTTQETSTEVAVGTEAREAVTVNPGDLENSYVSPGNEGGSIILTNGKQEVGKNATLTFGTDDYTVAREVFKKTGLTWGTDYANDQVNAVVYIEKPVDLYGSHQLSRGGLLVDPSLESQVFHTDGHRPIDYRASFKDGSLLMIKGSKFEDDNSSAIKSVHRFVDIDPNAKLFILDAEVGKTYNIIEGADVHLNGTYFQKILTNNPLVKFNADVKWHEVIVREGEDVNAQNINRYSVRAVPDTSNPLVTDFGELAGVTHGLYTNTLLSSDLAQDHLSISKHDTEMHKDLWAAYVHNRESVNGLELSKTKADYEGSYNNLIVGSDLYAKDNLVIGAAANYTTGKISSRNSTTYTKNEAKYYGASIYGRKINGKTAYLADISYLRGENDITQRVENSFIKGNPKTKAFTMGVKAEQAIEKSYGTLIPYAGVRYMHLDAEGYTTSLHVSYDPQGQDLLLLPFGVKYTTEKEMGNWKVKPMAEVGVVINTGDKGTKQTVSFEEDHETVGYEVVDGTSLIGKIGVQAEKKNMTIGASYQYQKSSHTSNNRIHLDLSYKF